MSIRFYTSGLLSKWGFDDGELLIDLLLDHGFTGSRGQVLAETVIQHVIPVLDQKEIELIKVHDWNWSCHNPIRAERVNGVEVDDLEYKPNPTLTPEFIDIEEEAILTIARRAGTLKD